MSIYLGNDKVSISGYVKSGITPSGTKEITENGQFDVTNFASALVNVNGETLFEKIYTFTPSSKTNVVTIPFVFSTTFILYIVCREIPTPQIDDYASIFLGDFILNNSQNKYISILRGKTTGFATGVMTFNNINRSFSDSYGKFYPQYTYDVYYMNLEE